MVICGQHSPHERLELAREAERLVSANLEDHDASLTQRGDGVPSVIGVARFTCTYRTDDVDAAVEK
jgi:hypothetical protein